MIRNYIKLAWRNLVKSKVSSFINIGGLAVGMAVAMLIGLWIFDEINFDTYHTNYAKLAQVEQQQTSNGIIYTGNSMPYPLGKELRTNYGENFKYLSMASWEGDHILNYADKNLSIPGIYMEPEGPVMLSLRMIKGSQTGLHDPHSILLASSTARALFGTDDVIGKTMKIDNKLDVAVTGVYEDLPLNTSFNNLKFIGPWDLYVESEPWIKRARDNQQWDNNSFQIFVQINDNLDFSTVDKRIHDAKLKRVDEDSKKYHAQILLNGMPDWHLRSHWDNNGNRTGGPVEYVWLFSLVGGFVLLLACINFMNLSTARSEKRAREVGIRKTIGSQRSQLVGQFYSESLMVVFFAFIIAILLTWLALPWFNQVSGKQMHIPWDHPVFWLIGLVFTIITGVIAGSYPALYLSSFQPVKVLKGTFRVGKLAALPRKVLVVTQFTISLALIIGTLIVYSQVQYSKNRPIGYNRDGLMMIEMKSPDYYGKYNVMKSELEKSGAVVQFAEASSPLTAIWSNNGGFHWAGMDPNLDTDFGTIWVSHDYGQTVGWSFKEGRDFSRDFPTDSLGIVVNEAAVKFMNVKNPVGMQVTWGEGKDAETFHIIGVIKDMVMQSPYRPVKQTYYFLDENNANWMVMRLNPNKSARESIEKAAAVFHKNIPSAPFDYKFADSEYAAKFAAEERVGTLSAFFAGLAIFISCLGLFGLASFVAEQKTKEIGIRKVLGASVTNLWSMLSRDFVILVLISCFIATPLAWYYMNGWLQKYPYRTDISWWMFLAAGLGGLLITLLTVSFQAIRAALANPVTSLRSE